jgi:hypothetical protein
LFQIKAKSCKAKGSRLEHKVAKMMVDSGIDPGAKRQLLSGGGYLKGDIYTELPICFECKNQESWSIHEWWDDLIEELPKDKMPILIMSKNRHGVFAHLKVEDLFEIIRFAQESGGWYKTASWKKRNS